MPLISLRATSLGHISDTISNSAPSKESNHTIRFFNPSFIPASGKITIAFQSGQFNIPAGFDYSDVDISVSPSTEENYTDRDVAAASDASADGVDVVSGLNGQITINLNSTEGIDAGKNVLIKLGNNALYGESGDQQVKNPSLAGTYSLIITTYNNSGGVLDSSKILVAIIDNIKMSLKQLKYRFNGKPTINDILTSESTITIMSLTTNYRSYCRFARSWNGDNPLASTTIFSDMTDLFTNTGQYYHSIFLMNLAPGYYQYYVRCVDYFGEMDDTGYLIEFRKAAPGQGTSGDDSGEATTGTGTGGGSGDNTGGGSRGSGGGGGGSGGGTGSTYGQGTNDLKPYPPELSQPDLILKGWAFPKGKITILKDGKEDKTSTADENGEFKVDYTNMAKGVYTFGVRGQDTDNRESEIFNSTVWLNEGQKTTLSQIFLPATLSMKNDSINVNDTVEAFGQSVPGSLVEVSIYLYTGKEPNPASMVKGEATTTSDGKWQAKIETKGLTKGMYKIRTRSKIASVGWSSYNRPQDLGIGMTVTKKGKRSDLNFDGKVNLPDFSILLYYWNSSNKIADINEDGKVNLTDFSLMMYDWTG